MAFLCLSASVSAQSIRGKVLDDAGLPLPGVSVTVVGTTTGTATDLEGNFTISAKAGDQLQFSFIGYNTQTVAAADGMTIKLAAASTDLSEVVVVGYGTSRKVDVTGSVSVVSEKDLRDRPNANPVSNIQGKVAGVIINNSGRPGEAPGVSIRGIGSIAGTAVLYVLDGVLTDNITYLNPSDIESMSILKDASSAAIYGIRAANGVIIVTTKMGRKGTGENIKFTYDGNVGFTQPTNVLDMADSASYVRLYNNKLGFEGGNPANQITLAQFDNVNTDWFDEITRDNAVTNSHNFGLTGASEKTQYFAGLGYYTQQGLLNANSGVASGDDFERLTARMSATYDVSSKLRIGGSMAYTKFGSNDPYNAFQDARAAIPLVAPRNADGSYDAESSLGTAGFMNPRFKMDIFRGKTKGTRTIMSGFAEYDIIKGLKFRTNYSRDYRTVNNYQYTAENVAPGFDPDTTPETPSQLTSRFDSFESILWENTITWEKSIDKHRFTVLGGFSRQQDTGFNLTGSKQGVQFFGDDSTLYLNLGSSGTDNVSSSGTKTRFQSYFARVQYAFDDKYLLNATVRRDGTSVYRFGDDQQSATFPSVGAGWIVSRESFLQNSGIDFLKLKASWGKLGNATIGRQFDETASVEPGAFFGIPSSVANAISVTQIVDPSIRWEVVTETDFGFESKFLNNRLSIEAGYYNRKTDDAVFAINVPPLSGLGSNVVTNAGSFVNKGFEIMASYDGKVNDKFTYNVYANLTTIDNEITQVLGGSFLNTGPGLFGNAIKRWEVGGEVGAYYGYNAIGVARDAAEAAAAGVPVGALIFEDRDDNGVIDENDKTFLGSPIPSMTYGFGFSLAYSGFDFAADFQGVAGNEIYNFGRNMRFGNENWDQDFADNSFNPTTGTGSYPIANSDQTTSRPSSFYVEKGDYFRLRNVQLGFTMPANVLKSLGVDRLRLYVSGQNVFTAFKYNGFTPEFGNQPITDSGIDNNVYPISATYSFGINLNF